MATLFETLPNAQAAIDEFLTVVKSSKTYACSHCGAESSATVTLKLCSGCQLTRYCSKSCQVVHWKTHKRSCRCSPDLTPRDVARDRRAQSFIRHLMRVSWIIILLDMYAIVALDLRRNPSNADKHCIRARITTIPAPDNLPATKKPAPPDNPIIMLQFERFEILPISRLTTAMRTGLENTRKRYTESGLVPPGTPFISMFFSTDGDNYVYEPRPLHPMLFRLANASSTSASLPLFDDGEPVTEAKVVDELNEFIRLDRENLCKARGPLHRKDT
ncbi:MYND-type domain-containing protein [Mycena indigotica]|uniref:MYND-type domain-containing protein n=1 Tax=Mycena indigotica TaxID=2126181 RepID=A0A8H6VYS3_9AGAR|nr:MYND-type domain-containing protein [Mycena indigotica]KAF7293079.1 MYND-type domain-containing protein [Mycena indigotica]